MLIVNDRNRSEMVGDHARQAALWILHAAFEVLERHLGTLLPRRWATGLAFATLAARIATVCKYARVGEQTGQTKNRSKLAPSRLSESI